MSDSASKVLSNKMDDDVSAVITMPLTERGRYPDKKQKSSNERKSSNRKKSKEVWNCKRHPNKRIKYYWETDKVYLCNTCKKEHKGTQHAIKQFKVDGKKIKVELTTMLKNYHTKVNQLLTVKQDLHEKMNESESKITQEIDKVTNHFNTIIEALSKKKAMVIDDLKQSINYNHNKVLDKYSVVLSQIEKMKEGWNSLNCFNSQGNKQPYEDFVTMKNYRQKELLQTDLVLDSSTTILRQPYPSFKENKNFWDNIGKIISGELKQANVNLKDVSIV